MVNMKFVLKNDYIFIVENEDLVYNNIEGEIVLENPSSDSSKIQYSVNDGLFKDVENNRISINTKELKEPYLSLRIRILHKDFVENFSTDKIPLTHALILGQPVEHQLPKTIRLLFEEIKLLKEGQKDIVKVLEYLDTKGDVL